MRITYGDNTLIRFKYLFMIVVLIIFSTQEIVTIFVSGENREPDGILMLITRYILIISLLITLIGYQKLSPFLKKVAILGSIVFLLLVLESFFKYNSYFIYPHVFSKILNIFLVLATYLFFQEVNPKEVKKIVYLILILFIVDLVVHKSRILSFSAFVSTERGFDSNTAYLLLLVGLYFLNKYLENGKTFNLLVFFVALGFIVFLQHRSVWVTSAVALAINGIIIWSKSRVQIRSARIWPIFLAPAIGISLIISFVVMDNPEVITKFQERFNDIQNYKSEGTGSWRYEQIQSYMPFVIEQPFIGQRFRGYELPIQFYNSEAGIPYFNDNTGHHFHNFYLDALFYLGIIGLLIIFLPMFYLFYKVFTIDDLSMEEISMVSFILSGIIFGLSYNWPVVFFGLIGMTLAFLEQKRRKVKNKEKFKIKNVENDHYNHEHQEIVN